MLFRDKIVEWRLALMIFAVVGPCLMLVTWPDMVESYGSYTWPSVTGTVVRPVIEQREDTYRGRKRMRYHGRVFYVYKINGNEYHSQLTDLGGGLPRRTPEQALADVRHYGGPGSQVTVYHDPLDPWRAVLTRGFATHRLVGFSLFAVMAIIGWISCALWIRDWLSNRGTVPQHILDKMN